jgi:hypothetical protein
VKPNHHSSKQGICNVLADERLFLPIVDAAIDLLRIAHRRIMQLKSKSGNVLINALTGQMDRAKKHLSGNATYQDLTALCVDNFRLADHSEGSDFTQLRAFIEEFQDTRPSLT